MNILHITDLHIHDPKSFEEKLRKGFYVDYIDGLIEKIQEIIPDKIDLILCTGDFVNKGKVENYEHVKVILNYLLNKLSLNNNDIAICIGNHDMVRDLEKKGKFIEARNEYFKLEKDYCVGSPILESDFYKIYYSDKNDLFLITFDSTFGAKGENVPTKLNDAQIDQVIIDLDETVPKNKTLLVLSHYPMILFHRSQVVMEEENWLDSHVWKSGNIIVERLFNRRKQSLTFWFFGDAHLADFWSYNDYHHFLLTGMIGGDYVNPTTTDKAGKTKAYNKTNQVKVIQLETPDKITIQTLNYHTKTYQTGPHLGIWENQPSDVRIIDNPFTKAIHRAVVIPKSKISYISKDSVQVEILNKIRDNKLYSFNRYSTSPNDVSLGWISITKLFEDTTLLSRCVDKTISWLRDNFEYLKIDKTNSVFIGIDFWGSILASQASLTMDVENYCLATKSRNEHNILLEKPEFLRYKIQDKHEHLLNVVLFTDVISTGGTIFSIKSKIETFLPDGKKLKWIAVSIISDKEQVKKINLNDFEALGGLCLDLRIPILKSDDLPSVDILPIRYDIQ